MSTRHPAVYIAQGDYKALERYFPDREASVVTVSSSGTSDIDFEGDTADRETYVPLHTLPVSGYGTSLRRGIACGMHMPCPMH